MPEKQQETLNNKSDTTFRCANLDPVAGDGDGREMTNNKRHDKEEQKTRKCGQTSLDQSFLVVVDVD